MIGQYVFIGILSGVIFGVLDGIINANPLAARLHEVYKPIARQSINAPAGVIIDVIYGLAMAGIFLVLYPSLPGGAGLVRGISFAIMAWFFRVLMSVASQWMMYTVPVKSLIYTAVAGLGEMLVIGILYGVSLHP